jgi:hypothetical protein
MRQVILQEFVSLDGLAAGPNQEARPFDRGEVALKYTWAGC